MAIHPDHEAEQAYLDRAYACLEANRTRAADLQKMVEVGRGGTEQARFERDVIWDTVLMRLQQLDLGDQSLAFGRIDLAAEAPEAPEASVAGEPGETYYIGRIAVSDEENDPVVVDWRAPVAEPFYRATGREPMGLSRRRHFISRGPTLLGVEDEYFGDAALELGLDEMADDELSGRGALVAAIEAPRTGLLGDIVATIQGEQDEVIRADLPGVLVVQGGPGTGKTVVALHRAAYLLYTHRFPLEGQGVLVVGPNRLFLGYIEQVLPSLGEAGVELAVLADLVGDAQVRGRDSGVPARIKGDLRMVDVIIKALRDRQRPLRRELEIGLGIRTLRFTVQQSERVTKAARQRFRTHNAARKFVEAELFEALADSVTPSLDPDHVRDQLRYETPVREALEWMWPVLTPTQVLHDLYGSTALLRSAAGRWFDEAQHATLHRERREHIDDVVFTVNDVPLLDEARARLGPRPGRARTDEVRTFGHIVVDEAQDLSPMELRSLTRRSLNGSMTVVGDIAQSTGAWAHDSWDELLDHLPDRRPARSSVLSVGYRIPQPLMDAAAGVLAEAAPQLEPPSAVRKAGEAPVVVPVDRPEDLAASVAVEVRRQLGHPERGAIAVITAATMVDSMATALEAAGIEFGRATRQGLRQDVTLVPIGLVKGLELDASVLVEPAAIVAEEPQGMRSLYVGLTRSTKRLSIVHAAPLPTALADRLR